MCELTISQKHIITERNNSKGEYQPAFMQIRIHNSFDGNIDELDVPTLGTLVHEYIHFLQNVSTPWGLYDSMVRYNIMAETYAFVENATSTITLPLNIDYSQGLKNKMDIVECGTGYCPLSDTRRNNFKIDKELLNNIVTKNKEIPESAARDLIIALITLKYTQSNSVCYAIDGQAIGVGAGQQSRIHCTRLAGNKADIWHLRQHDKVLNLPFKAEIGRPDRDNVIDQYISDVDSEELLENWEKFFTVKPEPLTPNEKKDYLKGIRGVALASDAFFPFDDNIERARKSGVDYIAEPGGSVRDDIVIDCCDKYGIAMAFTGMRLFHH